MKIEIKTNSDGIMVLAQALSPVYHANPIDKIERVKQCILMDVVDKVTSKTKELKRKATLFDTKKKVKITLKYSQAYFLSEYLKEIEPTNPYQRACIYKIEEQINTKL